MLWDPKARKVMGLAGSGKSPRGLSLETVRSRAKNGALPAYGAVTVSVPGTVDAWWMLHQRYGALKWADVLAPAIDLAENGAPVPDLIAWSIRRGIANFKRNSGQIEEIDNALKTWAPGGETPKTGSVFRNPDLARTLRLIAEGGRDAFYSGPIANTIDAYFKRIGGWLRYEDLAAHRGEWVEPPMTTYRGVGVHALGANTQGIATLQMLNILENFDLGAAGFQSPLSIHLQAEAKRLAYEDRARYYADPHFSKVPVDWLISKEYAKERAKLIRPDRILTPVYPGQAPSKGDTTYFCAADKNGMMVSMIQSNFRGMGSGLVADGLGFMFQDRGQLFSLKDGHPNVYAPGKRPFQTIIPGFATQGRSALAGVRRDGRRHATPGADADHRQPSGLRTRDPVGGRCAALASRGLVAIDERGRAGPARQWPAAPGTRRAQRRRAPHWRRSVGRSARAMAALAATSASSSARTARTAYTPRRARCAPMAARSLTDRRGGQRLAC